MQEVAERRQKLINDPDAAAADISRDPAVLATYRERFSLATVGARYKNRLEQLWNRQA